MKTIARAVFYLFAALFVACLIVILLSACSTGNPAQLREPAVTDELKVKQASHRIATARAAQYQNFLDSQAHINVRLQEEERAREARRQYDAQAFWNKQNRATSYRPTSATN